VIKDLCKFYIIISLGITTSDKDILVFLMASVYQIILDFLVLMFEVDACLHHVYWCIFILVFGPRPLGLFRNMSSSDVVEVAV
jgi:hypothetical protein